MMDSRKPDPNEEVPQSNVQQDSSALYSWANLHGAKYRDFSSLRRESRAQPRRGASQYESEQPLHEPGPADAPAFDSPVSRPSREVKDPSRPLGLERRKGVRRVETATAAEATARGEQGSIDDPAQRQAARDAEFDLRRHRAMVSSFSDPPPAPSGHAVSDAIPVRKIYREPRYDELAVSTDEMPPTSVHPANEFGPQENAPDFSLESMPNASHPPLIADSAAPAWLYGPPTPEIASKPLKPSSTVPPPSVADTLQSSRERVASRWFALKGVFERPGEEPAQAASLRQKETHTPILAVFSLAGGVGKTSLIATVGRSLSSMGEKVLLADMTSHGLLPYYFGANEIQYGVVRTFSPPSGSTDVPVYLVSHEMDKKGSEEAAQELFIEDLLTNSRGMHRILLDLSAASSWVIRQMARLNLTVLIPVAPDMNSVISLGFVEEFFSGLIDGDGNPLRPFYVLNQFDPLLPLHLDVREVLRRKLGDRLLPFVIRRAPSVSEALAEGMTVVDYAPDAPIAEDYISIATWLRSIAAPTASGFRNVRWSES